MKSRKTTVSLEDLLRIKRAEQPPAEFWNEFERDLRAKQLAAIVEPRPWWAPFIRVGARVAHYQLPVSAAAILVLSFVTVREYQAPGVSPAFAPQSALHESVAVTNGQQSTPSVLEVSTAPVAYRSADLDLAAADVVEPLTEESSVAGAASTVEPARILALDREPSPSERYIAANLAAAQAADPRLMDDVFGASMRSAPVRQPVRDPLAQSNGPGESRRSRLLATALPVNATANDLPVGTSDRVARHLTEERLYDTITRVGLKGDRVAIKF
ncbi:MAG: hypothetical protein ABIZ04_09165 [Opitutus sp.]